MCSESRQFLDIRMQLNTWLQMMQNERMLFLLLRQIGIIHLALEEKRLFFTIANQSILLNKNKPEEEQIVIIKAWNEWGEGNHLEPDLKYGKGYLEAIKEEKGRKGSKNESCLG